MPGVLRAEPEGAAEGGAAAAPKGTLPRTTDRPRQREGNCGVVRYGSPAVPGCRQAGLRETRCGPAGSQHGSCSDDRTGPAFCAAAQRSACLQSQAPDSFRKQL